MSLPERHVRIAGSLEAFADLPVRNLRQTILHVTTKTACHAGHLDAARELLDGRQHLVLT